MTESLIGRTVRITGGELFSAWLDDPDHVITGGPKDDGTVMVTTKYGSIWVAIGGSTWPLLTGELVPETPTLIGRHVRLTGKGWGLYGMPERESIHVITHEAGFTRWLPTAPGINPDGDEAHVYYVVIDPEGVDPVDVRDWAAELLPAHPDEPPIGSIVAAAFDDVEGDCAQRASDGPWLVAGECSLFSWEDLIAMARESITVLRSGYGEEDD